MEIHQLRAFLAVARHGHFGVAAEHLRLARPQVSRRITQLEEDLQVRLFMRSTRRVELTDAGRALLPDAVALIRRADDAIKLATDSVLGRNGLLRLVLIDAAMLGTVTPILRNFRLRYPEVYIDLHNPGMNSAAFHQLDEGEADIVFAHPPRRLRESYATILLVDDPLVAVLPENHRLAKCDRLDLSDLADEPWIMFPRERSSNSVYDRIIALCHRSGFHPRIVRETAPMLTRLGVVASGFGVTLVHVAWRRMPYPGLVYVPIEPTANVMLSCFWSRNNDSPLLKNMIEIVRTHAI